MPAGTACSLTSFSFYPRTYPRTGRNVARGLGGRLCHSGKSARWLGEPRALIHQGDLGRLLEALSRGEVVRWGRIGGQSRHCVSHGAIVRLVEVREPKIGERGI